MNQAKSKLRVMLVSSTSWHLYNFRLILMKELLSRGYHVIALSPYDDYVKHLNTHGIAHVNIRISRSGLNPFDDIYLLFKFWVIYCKYRPTVIQHYTSKPNIYGTIAGKFVGVKYIYNMITGLGYIFTGNDLTKLFLKVLTRFLYKIALPFSTHVYFQNRDDRNYFINHQLVDKNKTSIVPGTGVDTLTFTPVKKNKREGVAFILVSRMLWDKGVGEFVTAARTLKRIHKESTFLLLGPIDFDNPTGISQKQLESWNSEGSVEYLGKTDNVRPYLERTDVMVLPSYREGLPLSLLEGAAMGMPIITTDSPGCREVVEHGKNGYIVPIKDSEKLATAMEQFILNPKLIDRMGKESREMAISRFDSRKIVKEILQFYPL